MEEAPNDQCTWNMQRTQDGKLLTVTVHVADGSNMDCGGNGECGAEAGASVSGSVAGPLGSQMQGHNQEYNSAASAMAPTAMPMNWSNYYPQQPCQGMDPYYAWQQQQQNMQMMMMAVPPQASEAYFPWQSGCQQPAAEQLQQQLPPHLAPQQQQVASGNAQQSAGHPSRKAAGKHGVEAPRDTQASTGGCESNSKRCGPLSTAADLVRCPSRLASTRGMFVPPVNTAQKPKEYERRRAAVVRCPDLDYVFTASD